MNLVDADRQEVLALLLDECFAAGVDAYLRWRELVTAAPAQQD